MFVTDSEVNMNTSSKFVVATHILTALAGRKEYFCEGTVTKSDYLAESVNTNPVVIRRILGMLNQAGLKVERRWRDLHVLSWDWITMRGLRRVPIRATQALALSVWPLRWQYQVYHLCAAG